MNNLTKNYIYMFISNFLPKALSLFFLTPYLARTLGLEGIGIFSYSYNIVSWFILITDFGISIYANKKIAETRNDKENNNFHQILFLQLILHFLGFILYLMFVLFQKQEYQLVLLILSIYLLADSFNICWFYSGIEDFKTVSIRNLINQILTFILIILFVHNLKDIYTYVFICLLSKIISEIFLFIKFKNKKQYINYSYKKNDLQIHLKDSFKYFIPQFAISIYTLLDQIMLGFLTDAQQVGLYSKAETPIKLLVQIVTLISTISFPKFSNLNKKEKKSDLIYYFNKILDFLLMFSIPLCLGMMATSNTFVIWYLSFEFETSGHLMMLLSPIIIFMSIGNILGTYLMATDKTKKYTISLFIGAFFNFSINLFAINKMGAYGTVLSTLISEFAVFIYLILIIKKLKIINISFLNIIKYSISSIIMFIVVKSLTLILPISPLSSIFEMIIGIVIYFIFLIILKRIKPSDIKNFLYNY